MKQTLAQRLVAEGVGTGFLVAAIIGSGVMAERLAQGNSAIALLANTIATGAALVSLILSLGPISGAHFNPAVTLSFALQSTLSGREASLYIVVQLLGAAAGVVTANLMFQLPLVSFSGRQHTGAAQIFAEVVATFGLVLVIRCCAKLRSPLVAFAVGAYISAAYWFTSSTSFANPAVTLARSLSDSFAGIRPIDVPAFVLAQLIGGLAATLVARWMVLDSDQSEHEGKNTGTDSLHG